MNFNELLVSQNFAPEKYKSRPYADNLKTEEALKPLSLRRSFQHDALKIQ